MNATPLGQFSEIVNIISKIRREAIKSIAKCRDIMQNDTLHVKHLIRSSDINIPLPDIRIKDDTKISNFNECFLKDSLAKWLNFHNSK